MKERARIGIAGVGLEPDAVLLARRDITTDQRRFARTRRAGNPEDRMRAQRVDPREQPLALQDVIEARTAELGKRNRRRRHSS